MSEQTRRGFMVQAGVASAALAGAATLTARAQTQTTEAKKEMADSKKILVAADPYAVSLKKSPWRLRNVSWKPVIPVRLQPYTIAAAVREK